MCSVTGTVYFLLSVYYYSHLLFFFSLLMLLFFFQKERDVMYGSLGTRVYASLVTMCI